MMERARQVRKENPELIKAAAQVSLAASAVGTAIVGAVIWMGGVFYGPGARMEAMDTRLTALVDTLQMSVTNAQTTKAVNEVRQDEAIVGLREDLLTVLTLQCSASAVQKIRERGQYAAAARCESLVKTGR